MKLFLKALGLMSLALFNWADTLFMAGGLKAVSAPSTVVIAYIAIGGVITSVILYTMYAVLIPTKTHTEELKEMFLLFEELHQHVGDHGVFVDSMGKSEKPYNDKQIGEHWDKFYKFADQYKEIRSKVINGNR